MAKASKKSPEEKLRVVLSVLRGELSVEAAGRRAGVSEQRCITGRRRSWRVAGTASRSALGAGRRARPSVRN